MKKIKNKELEDIIKEEKKNWIIIEEVDEGEGGIEEGFISC